MKINPDDVYQQIVDICNYIIEKRKEGWLLMDEDNKVVDADIKFTSPFNEKCIVFQYERNSYGYIVVYNDTTTWGSSTLLQEYRQALKHMKLFKLFEPKKIHKL